MFSPLVIADSYHRTTDARLRLRPLGGLDDARPAWEELAAGSDNVFATWDWNALWWRHLGEGKLALTGCFDADGELRAILPLHVHDGTGRFLGHGESDQLGPVCEPARRPAAARALVAALRRGELPSQRLLADDVPRAERWDRLPGARRIASDASPVLRAPNGWPGFLAARSRNFRAQVGARERRLARRHALRFRLCETSAEVGGDMDALIALHEARWGRESGALRGARARLHREFAAVALRRGWLRLWTLELDGAPAAVLYGLRFGGAESYYQSGRDPARADESVGFVLLAHAVRRALEEVAEYRLLRGDEPYKRRFSNADVPIDTFVIE